MEPELQYKVFLYTVKGVTGLPWHLVEYGECSQGTLHRSSFHNLTRDDGGYTM